MYEGAAAADKWEAPQISNTIQYAYCYQTKMRSDEGSGRLLFRHRQKLRCDHFVKEKGEQQSERHAQDGIYDTEKDGLLDAINTGAQHQCAKAIYGCFVAVIGTEAQAQSTQRAEQGVQCLWGQDRKSVV